MKCWGSETMQGSNPLAAIIPTLDGTGNLLLVSQIYRVGAILGRPMILAVSDKFGVWNSRYDACQKLSQTLGKSPTEPFRALMVDSDQNIENPNVLAEYILRADREGCSFMPSVRLKGQAGNVYAGGVSVDPATRDWDMIHPKGCGGLYYGNLYGGYPWHNDPFAGEDSYFLKENPYIVIRFAKRLDVSHYARVKLSLHDVPFYQDKVRDSDK